MSAALTFLELGGAGYTHMLTSLRHRLRYANRAGEVFHGQCPASVSRLEGVTLIEGPVDAVACSGRYLAMLNRGTLSVWELRRGTCSLQWSTARVVAVSHVHWTPADDTFTFVGYETDRGLLKVDCASGRVIASAPFSDWSDRIDYCPAGAPLADHMVVIDGAEVATLYSPALEPLWKLDLSGRGGHVVDVDFDLRGTHFRASACTSSDELIVDVATRQVTRAHCWNTRLWDLDMYADIPLVQPSGTAQLLPDGTAQLVFPPRYCRGQSLPPGCARQTRIHAPGLHVQVRSDGISATCGTHFDQFTLPCEVCGCVSAGGAASFAFGWVASVAECARDELTEVGRAVTAVDDAVADNAADADATAVGLVRAVLVGFVLEDARIAVLKIAAQKDSDARTAAAHVRRTEAVQPMRVMYSSRKSCSTSS